MNTIRLQRGIHQVCPMNQIQIAFFFRKRTFLLITYQILWWCSRSLSRYEFLKYSYLWQPKITINSNISKIHWFHFSRWDHIWDYSDHMISYGEASVHFIIFIIFNDLIINAQSFSSCELKYYTNSIYHIYIYPTECMDCVTCTPLMKLSPIV